MAISAQSVRAGKAYVELGVHDKLARGLRRAQRRLKAFGAGVTQLGMRLSALANTVLVGFGATVFVFAKFDEQMRKVSTMLSEADKKFLPIFAQSVKKFMVEFGRGSQDITDALYDILSAGVPASKAIDFLNASLKTAVAQQGSVKETTSAMITLMETYGDRFRDAADAGDFLSRIIWKARTDMAQLAPTIGRVISTADAAGLSIEDMGASLAILTRATGSTEMAITSLSAIATTFLKPTKESAELWKEKFGTAMNYATVQTEGMLGVLQKLQTLDPSAVARIFPNVRAIRGMLPALKKMEGFGEIVAEMADRAGATDVAYREMAAGLMQAFRQIKQSAVVTLLAVGQTLAPAVAKLTREIKANIGAVMKWLQANHKAIFKTLRLAVTISAIGTALMILGGIISATGAILGALAVVIKTVIVAVKGLSVAIVFLSAHPAVLIAAAVAALIALFIDWGKVLRRVTGMVKSALPSFTSFTAETRKSAEQIRLEHQEMKTKAERLAELRKKQSLTNDELMEATTLAQALAAVYPELAEVINDLVGSTENLGKTTATLVAEMDKLTAARIKATYVRKLEEAQDWLRGYEEEAEALKFIMGQYRQLGVAREHIDQLAKNLKEAGENAAQFRAKVKLLLKTIAELGKVEIGRPPVPPPRAKAPPVVIRENIEAARELARVKIQALEDPYHRELALAYDMYAQKIRLARKEGKDITAILKARAIEIRAIERRHHRQAEEEIKRHEQTIQDEIARLKIEATKKGLDKDLALLKLRENAELAEAKKVGASLELIRKKFALEREMLGMPDVVADTRETRGTFYAQAIQSLMGAGADTAERTANAVERIVRNTATLRGAKRLAFT